MRDNRSTQIKQILKKAYPAAEVKVRIHKYSMGESIYVLTDLIKEERVIDPQGYGYTINIPEKSKENRRAIEILLNDFKSIDRDEMGEILSGGNTFLFVEPMQRI